MGQAANADRLIATDPDQVRDQVSRGVVVRGGELHCPLRLGSPDSGEVAVVFE